MARFSINLRDLVILVADPSSYMSMLILSMLRGFGSNKVLEARSSTSVLQISALRLCSVCSARLGTALAHLFMPCLSRQAPAAPASRASLSSATPTITYRTRLLQEG